MRTRPLTKREKEIIANELSNAALWDGHSRKDADAIGRFEGLIRDDLVRVVIQPKRKVA
jgi:hypothetical protein